ncbi:MAG: septum formation protein Maf [Sinobacteraceae bacterium]|nr:septum formation protein Maf [Nevskiaceae bacterium]
MSPPRLILASTSPYRHALLQRFGLPFEVARPEVSEAHVDGELPPDRAARLSLAKAQAAARKHPDAVVIGSDQVAACGHTVLDKPGSAERCRAQLTQLSGSVARFHTSCTVLTPELRTVHLDTTTVMMRALSADEIERYVERERPFDCAGSFKVESLGIALFESIETCDPTALIGLPLIWLAGALRGLGYPLP